MGKLSTILRDHRDEHGTRYLLLHCPGCKRAHYVPIERHPDHPGAVWVWSQDTQVPTMLPEVVVRQPAHKTPEGEDVAEQVLCRFELTLGQVTFGDDSAHGLRGTHDLLAFKHPEDLPPLPRLARPSLASAA